MAHDPKEVSEAVNAPRIDGVQLELPHHQRIRLLHEAKPMPRFWYILTMIYILQV